MRRIEISGDLEKRMRLAIQWQIEGRKACGLDDKWILNDLKHTLPEPRTSEDFTGDVWGAHIETMSVLSRITGERYVQVDELLHEVLLNQQDDGSFWNIIPAEKDIPAVVSDNRAWGWQRTLIGFVEHYRTFGDNAVLDCATRLADFLLKLYEQSKTLSPDCKMVRTMRGSLLYPPSSYWSAVTQGLTRLYQVTKTEKYLTAAIEIANSVPTELLDVENTTDWLSWHGLMLLYEETRDKRYIETVKKNVHSVMQMVTVLGDTPHLWCWPNTNEACGLADSITVNCDLWRATLDSQYMDAVERVVYNAFSASMYTSEGWGRYAYAQRVTKGRHADPQEESVVYDRFADIYKNGCTPCCDWHVPIAFRDIIEHIYWQGDQSDVYVNLFVSSRNEFLVGAGEFAQTIRLEQETDYPQNGTVVIKMDVDSPLRFPLHIRIPYWAEDALLSINQEAPVHAAAGRYMILEREWHQDILRLVLPMPIRAEEIERPWGRPVKVPESGISDRVALLKGPVVLVLDKDRNPDIAPLWNDAEIAEIRPVLVVPTSECMSSSFDLPHDFKEIPGGRPFSCSDSHYQSI